MKLIVVTSIFLMLGCATQALDSIMYTPTEVAMIKGKRKERNLSRYRNEGYLICDGIFFVNQDNWTVWLNNKMVTSRLKHPDVQVHKVTADMVSLTWMYKGKEHAVFLRSQQGYDGELRKVIN